MTSDLEEAKEEIVTLRRRVAQLETAAQGAYSALEFAELAVKAAMNKAGSAL